MAAQTNFIDIATIWLHAGKGGDGAVSFHREKFVAAGGPDGGDGGRGGDIIFVVDDHLTTLMDFRYKRKYTADEGGKGGASLCHGKNAENLVIKVPLGSVFKDAESGLVIADLSDHSPVTIAKGGRGGYGNAHFATPTRQIPKFAKPGMPGEDIQVTLELKLIADVGLIGFPNVGKSTFINTFAGSARAKAADRPGVTKGKQWVSTEKFDLLDMPGVLWKKFDSKTIASNLAFIGSIKDDILDVEELAMNLLDEVRRNYPELVAQRYKLDAETLALPPYELMEAIGRKRGLLVRGGEVNTERCAIMLVDEFRACKWGRISLERPPQRDDLADFAEDDDE